jgi:hypothetical protein
MKIEEKENNGIEVKKAEIINEKRRRERNENEEMADASKWRRK